MEMKWLLASQKFRNGLIQIFTITRIKQTITFYLKEVKTQFHENVSSGGLALGKLTVKATTDDTISYEDMLHSIVMQISNRQGRSITD